MTTVAAGTEEEAAVDTVTPTTDAAEIVTMSPVDAEADMIATMIPVAVAVEEEATVTTVTTIVDVSALLCLIVTLHVPLCEGIPSARSSFFLGPLFLLHSREAPCISFDSFLLICTRRRRIPR